MTSSLQKPSPVLIANIVLFLPAFTGQGLRAGDRDKQFDNLIRIEGKSIKINRSLTSKKYRIRLYPDTKQEAMFFSASGPKEKLYQLFLFDLGGRLITQASIAHKQTTLVKMKTKGTYLFEVFSDDEKIESGEVLVN